MDSHDMPTAECDVNEATVSSTLSDKKNTGAEVSPSAAPADGPRPPRKKTKLSTTDPTLPVDVEALKRADSSLEADDYKSAGSIAKAILESLGDLSTLPDKLCTFSGAALILGKSLLNPLVKDEAKKDPRDLLVPLKFFKLALRLDPENEEAEECIEAISQVLPKDKDASEQNKPKINHSSPLDVIVVGAGASGVGMGVMLTRVFGLDPARVLLVERGAQVGETFSRWPKEMSFISPSFNNQGWTNSFDLNSIAYGTSPAFTLHAEHPKGDEYARYLRAVASETNLNVQTHTEVTALRPFASGEGFEVDIASTSGGVKKTDTLRSRYVIWAAGEFQYPRTTGPSMFTGAELCLHNSSVRSWSELKGNDFVVIGGYESGMDAAFNLSSCGKQCTVLASTAYWHVVTSDPSSELAPYTANRIRVACASAHPPRLLAPLRVFKVEAKADGGGYLVHARRQPKVEHDPHDDPHNDGDEGGDGDGHEHRKPGKHRVPLNLPATDPLDDATEITLSTPHPPVLCAGFEGSVKAGVAKDLFEWGMVDTRKKDEEGEEEEEGEAPEMSEDNDSGEGPDLPAPNASPSVSPSVPSPTAPLVLASPAVTAPTAAPSSAPALTQPKVSPAVAEVAASVGGADTEASGKVGCLDMSPLLTEFDESTKTPGLFLVGPSVAHEGMSFCFVYKFRQRFAIVAEKIARGLGRRVKEAVESCFEMDMYLDDFSCCEGACGENC